MPLLHLVVAARDDRIASGPHARQNQFRRLRWLRQQASHNGVIASTMRGIVREVVHSPMHDPDPIAELQGTNRGTNMVEPPIGAVDERELGGRELAREQHARYASAGPGVQDTAVPRGTFR